MSLVSTYVEAVDGKFYQNPTIYGPGWYICFDDNDPPELVVTLGTMKDLRGHLEQRIESKANWEMVAIDILAKAGIDAQNVKRQGATGRCFPPNDRLHMGMSFFFDLQAPIPVPTKFDSVGNDTSHDCVAYRFSTKAKSSV